MNEDTISVREYAEITGVSVQAIYKRIRANDSSLKPYIVSLQPENGSLKPKKRPEKRLKSSILDDPELNQKRGGLKPSLQPDTTGLQPSLKPQKSAPESSESASDRERVEDLERENEDLRKRIEDLNAKNEDLRNLNAELRSDKEYFKAENAKLLEVLHTAQFLQAKQALVEHPQDEPDQAQPMRPSLWERWKNWWSGTTPKP